MTKSSYGAKDRAFDAERAKFRRERNDLRKQIERERRAQDDLRADIDELRSRLASQDEWIERLLELTELTPAEAKNLVEDRRRQADATESLDAVLGRDGLLGGLLSRMAPGIASSLSMFAVGAGETGADECKVTVPFGDGTLALVAEAVEDAHGNPAVNLHVESDAPQRCADVQDVAQVAADGGRLRVLLWADARDESHTHEFDVDVYADDGNRRKGGD